jgi:hypothetical protein
LATPGQLLVPVTLTTAIPIIVTWTSGLAITAACKGAVTQLATAIFIGWAGFCVARGGAKQLLTAITNGFVLAAVPSIILGQVLPYYGYEPHWSVFVAVPAVSVFAYGALFGKMVNIDERDEQYISVVLSYEAIFVACLTTKLLAPDSDNDILTASWWFKYNFTREAASLVYEAFKKRKLEKKGKSDVFSGILRVFQLWIWSQQVDMAWFGVLVYWGDWDWLLRGKKLSL